MIIKLEISQFIETGGFYYSPAFKQDSLDDRISVAVWLNSSGTVSIQASLDEADWADIEGTSFACSPFGLQSYVECHIGVAYRLKMDVIPERAWILA